ncbi:MAG: hypothetical protein KGH75_00705 [Rhodospirillales bacterium]|nr:hypothetical protein [Rhodospirillales bacterium]
MSQSFRDRIRPWECAACHTKNISANKTECPKCHEPRAGSAAAAAQEASGQTTRIYEGEQALQAGIAEMARQGWRVVSQSSHQPSSGVGRAVALGGIGAMIFKPPIKFTVIFERIAPPDPAAP